MERTKEQLMVLICGDLVSISETLVSMAEHLSVQGIEPEEIELLQSEYDDVMTSFKDQLINLDDVMSW